MKQNEIELLNGEIIAPETLEEIEESECVAKVDNLGWTDTHKCDWYSVEFTDGSDIDVYVNEVSEKNNEVEINEEKVEELMGMGEVFRELQDVVDWCYVTNTRIKISTKHGIYQAEKVHGTWGFLIKAEDFIG